MTRLSCHRFRSNQVRLALSPLAYNLGNLWRRLALPRRIENWSLTSLQQRLVKTGGRLVKHARYYWLFLAEGHLNRRRFGAMLGQIALLPMPRDRWMVVQSAAESVYIALASLLLCCVAASACQAQTRPVLCSRGDGNFEAEFRTGVGLRVEAARNGELATRVCEATLNWDGQQLVIAAGAAQLDVDAFGVDLDLGVGAPVAALQVKKSDAECCMAYRIYSLLNPPRLLRTITGGDFFSAADTDLDGRVEIWTDDAAAVDGFEHLELSSLDAAPTMVLRFAHGQLLDVSSEFQPDFDRQVEKLRAELYPQDLRDFKSSDGRLTPTASFSLEALHRRDRLQAAKIKVLEIVWSYLYSGREQEAWHSLTDLWPAADVDRIRAAILTARARGIRAQVNGTSAGVPTGGRTQASIYDALIVEAGKPELVPPRSILLRRPPPLGASEQGLAAAKVRLALVVDSAGKVRSAQPVDSAEWVDAGLKAATANWKFIPAFKDGRAVASRIGFVVSLKR